jgi:hypothetical protein
MGAELFRSVSGESTCSNGGMKMDGGENTKKLGEHLSQRYFVHHG